MFVANGSFEVLSERYPTVVHYAERFATTLDVAINIGPERVVGSVGFFRCRNISASAIEVRGEEHAVRSFTEILTVFCQDVNR